MGKEAERKHTIRFDKIGMGLLAVGGIALIGHAGFDHFAIRSPSNIERRAGQLAPGYHPKEYQAADQAVITYIKRIKETQILEDLIREGAKVIEIPEEVTQAATFINNNRVSYDKGQKLEDRMKNNILIRLREWTEVIGGSILVVFGLGYVFLIDGIQEEENKMTKRTASSSTKD